MIIRNPLGRLMRWLTRRLSRETCRLCGAQLAQLAATQDDWQGWYHAFLRNAGEQLGGLLKVIDNPRFAARKARLGHIQTAHPEYQVIGYLGGPGQFLVQGPLGDHIRVG